MVSKHLKKENTEALSHKHMRREEPPNRKPASEAVSEETTEDAGTKTSSDASQDMGGFVNTAGPPRKEKLLQVHRLPRQETAPAADAQAAAQVPRRVAVPSRPIRFRRDRRERTPEEGARAVSRRDAAGAIISLVAALAMLAAAIVVWLYRDRFQADNIVLSSEKAAVAVDEYVFDAGSGEAFAVAGKGLAVANSTGVELLDGEGNAVTSMVMQMDTPATAGCDNYAVFYDLGGTRLTVTDLEGGIQDLAVQGEIISAAVSDEGYLAVTTKCTGYRALVSVYNPLLELVYEWYSSSAWVISGLVSPDGKKLAVLSYTASGSEVRFFDLHSDEQQGAFSVSDTVLLDLHWFSSNQLCAFSTGEAFFFNSRGDWQNTYSFAGQYLTGYTFSGDGFAAFALSPYRAGTTATLVSLDPTGTVLGTAEVESGIVCLHALGSEILLLCADGATLYSSALHERGTLAGLPGFKYGLLRDKGEALLVAANYADVYHF